jgi:hypothetical protein
MRGLSQFGVIGAMCSAFRRATRNSWWNMSIRSFSGCARCGPLVIGRGVSETMTYLVAGEQVDSFPLQSQSIHGVLQAHKQGTYEAVIESSIFAVILRDRNSSTASRPRQHNWQKKNYLEEQVAKTWCKRKKKLGKIFFLPSQ